MPRETKTFGFADLAVKNKGNNKFLSSVNDLINWTKLEKIIKKYDKRGKSVDGTPAYSSLLLFKIILLQTWFNLSDPQVEEAVNDRISFMKFLDLSISSDIPDHSTICRFRNMLNDKKVFEKLFKEVNIQLEKLNLIVKTGAIVDASIVSANRRPRKVMEVIPEDRKEDEITGESVVIEYSKDPDARWIKKGRKSLFGFKIHNAVDGNGFILGGSVTSANVADMKELENILLDIDLPNGSSLMADKGYAYKINRELLKECGYEDLIMVKKQRGKDLSDFDKSLNKAISKIRYRVEQTFGLLKLHFGFDRARYVGIDKFEMEYRIKAMAFNIKKAVGILV